jgi:hypothetical protein
MEIIHRVASARKPLPFPTMWSKTPSRNRTHKPMLSAILFQPLPSTFGIGTPKTSIVSPV